MNLYEELNLELVRSKPDVWVSRVVIFERITPSPVVIRDIPLCRGLNLIWAEEAEDDSSKPNITGHSAGKTTFCRLFRYIMGEKTFGSKAAMELIRKAFPDGYVAAELHVVDRKWAVRRPLGTGRMSFIKEGSTIEELLESRGQAASQEQYLREIGLESIPGELQTGEIAQAREPVQWPHILAWCTRDQEARFQSIHEWRSPRSEAGTPSFRSPRADPLFVMRAVLGLFLPDELQAEEMLTRLQKDKEAISKEIEEKRREPQFRVNLYEHQLRKRLKAFYPNEPNIDSMPFRSDNMFVKNLERLTAGALEALGESIKKNEQERHDLQTQIDTLGAELGRREETLERLKGLFAFDEAKSRELDADPAEERRNKIEKYKENRCPFVDIPVGQCSHVLALQRVVPISKLQDQRAMKEEDASLLAERRKIEVRMVSLQEEIERIKKERQNAIDKRKALADQNRKQEYSRHGMEDSRDEFITWMQRRDKLVGYDELASLRRKLSSVEEQSARLEEELKGMIRQHDENRNRLAAIFSKAVRSVLSSEEYDGWVSLENRELSFRITHGPAMSGEAVETLSVLLADVTALIYNTVTTKGHLPGFLLHDSPREADLGIQIYRSYIRFVASLQEHFGEPESCPFQYLITTTTAPPKELQTEKFVKLKLNASTPEGLLLRRNIAVQLKMPQQLPMFPT